MIPVHQISYACPLYLQQILDRYIMCLQQAATFGDSGSSYSLHTPPRLAIAGFNIHLKHAPSSGDSCSTKVFNTWPLIWRFRFIIYLQQLQDCFIIYLQQTPSCGDSGSSYILNTPPPVATPVHHTSLTRSSFGDMFIIYLQQVHGRFII